MRHCTTSQPSGSISRCPGSFGNVQKLAVILVNVEYLKMIVLCRMTSHDIVRRRGTSYDICAMVVQRRRTTSSMIVRRRTTSYGFVRHRMTVIRSSYDIVEVARPSRDFNLLDNVSLSPSNHSEVVCHRTTIVRLSLDWNTMSYDLPMI